MKLNVASHLDELEFVMFVASGLTSVSFLVGASVMGTCKTHGVQELVSKVVVVVVGKVLVVVLVLVAVLDVLEVSVLVVVVTVTVLVVTVVLVVVTVVVVVVVLVVVAVVATIVGGRWRRLSSNIPQGGPTSSEQLRPDPTMAL